MATVKSVRQRLRLTVDQKPAIVIHLHGTDLGTVADQTTTADAELEDGTSTFTTRVRVLKDQKIVRVKVFCTEVSLEDTQTIERARRIQIAPPQDTLLITVTNPPINPAVPVPVDLVTDDPCDGDDN